MTGALIPLLSAAIGAVSALGGVLLKLLYDRRVERNKQAFDLDARFLSERRTVYDDFLTHHHAQATRSGELRELSLIVRDGGEAPRLETLSDFPASRMAELIGALESIKRLARSYALIRSAEQIVRLHGDLATANKKMLEVVTSTESRRDLTNDEKQQDDILWFVLKNMLRDRELEFVYAYRSELGIGDPHAGPSQFPMEARIRPFSLDESEHIVRAHVLPDHLRNPQACGLGSRPENGTQECADDAREN